MRSSSVGLFDAVDITEKSICGILHYARTLAIE